MHRNVRRLAAALIVRAKVFLTSLALVAAVVLVAVGSWPLKILVVLAFVRGVFASDLVVLRNAGKHRASARVPRASPGVAA